MSTLNIWIWILICCVAFLGWRFLKCSIFLFKSEFTTAIAHSVLDIFNSRMFRYILNRCKDWFCMRCFGKTIWLSGDMKALNNVTRISLERFSYFQIVFFKFLHAQYLFCWLNVVRFFSRIFSYLYWSVFTLVLILLTAFKLFKICFFFFQVDLLKSTVAF